MPFELGLAVERSVLAPRSHDWYVFEEVPQRLARSLSDLGGTDPYIHRGSPDRLVAELCNALVRVGKRPALPEVQRVHDDLRGTARALRRDHPTLFAARPFLELVVAATRSARRAAGSR
jgi:hypothetical protein